MNIRYIFAVLLLVPIFCFTLPPVNAQSEELRQPSSIIVNADSDQTRTTEVKTKKKCYKCLEWELKCVKKNDKGECVRWKNRCLQWDSGPCP